MTKQAYRDKDGTIKYIEISDRKKCLTYAEWQYILKNTQMKNHEYSSGTDTKFVNGKRENYFWCKFNHYAGYPLTIAEIHSKYGRGIEVITTDIGYPNVQLEIRAYNDFR